MSHIFPNIRRVHLLFSRLCVGLFATSLLLCSGCSSASDKKNTVQTAEQTQISEDAPLRDSTPVVLTPAGFAEDGTESEADPSMLYETDIVRLDASHASDGYILVTYKGTNEKVKFQIQAPDGITYTYLVSETESAIVYPLTGGNGDYLFTLFESVDVEENLYAIVFTQTANVQLSDEFLPFLTPNVYVWFTPGSPSVAAGIELAKNCHTDLEVIGEIYKHVTGTISYDTEKAADVTYGYIPNPDQTLELKKGICFDYASLMATMLRSQRIPTKLEVGYAGEVYHAWISCYVEEIGWVDGIIQFDGEHWSLMDPTLAANNDSKAVEAYIGDGSKYTVKYTY